jgi:hypothetical protein
MNNMINKKYERTTRGIKNCRGTWLIKVCNPLQPSCILIGNRPQSATFHTAKRCSRATLGETAFVFVLQQAQELILLQQNSK